MNLDDLTEMKSVDEKDLAGSLRCLPESIIKAWNIGLSQNLLFQNEINHILLCGTGSGLIAARLLQSFLSASCSTPVSIHDDFSFPKWVNNPKILVILISEQGDEPELIRFLQKLHQTTCQTVVVSTTGLLIELAKEQNKPVFTYSYSGTKRTSIGFHFFIPLAILSKAGIIQVTSDEIQFVCEQLQKTIQSIDLEIPVAQNPAKRMAGQFLNRWVTLFGSGIMAAVAEYWKAQINMNGKAWAQVEKIPETCHSTVGGIYFPADQLSHMMTLFIQSGFDHPSHHVISEEVRKMFMVEGFNTDFYEAPGESVLSCMWNAILYGGYISYYLAMAYDIDPSQVPGVDEMEGFIASLD